MCTYGIGKRLIMGLTGTAIAVSCGLSMGSPADGAQGDRYYLISHGMDIAIVASDQEDVTALVSQCGYDASKFILDVSAGDGYTAVTLRDAMEASVTVDGETLTVRASGGTVEQLLEELNVELAADDIISHSKDEALRDGMAVRVYRVTFEEEYTDETVAHGTKYTDDATMNKGTEKTVTEGSDGTKRLYYRVKYVDGVEDSRELVREETVKEAVDTVISRGTKVESKKTDTGKSTTTNKSNGTTGNTNTTSKNNGTTNKTNTTHSVTVKDGTITTASGETYNYSKVVNMKATAYSYSAGSITASGAPVQVGIVAAKPSTLPQGTRVYIVTEDGKYTYGPAIVGDTPGGDIIDLFYETEEECRQFGVRQANVYVLS